MHPTVRGLTSRGTAPQCRSIVRATQALSTNTGSMMLSSSSRSSSGNQSDRDQCPSAGIKERSRKSPALRRRPLSKAFDNSKCHSRSRRDLRESGTQRGAVSDRRHFSVGIDWFFGATGRVYGNGTSLCSDVSKPLSTMLLNRLSNRPRKRVLSNALYNNDGCRC